MVALAAALAVAAGVILALKPEARAFVRSLPPRLEHKFWNIVDPPVGVATLKPRLVAEGMVFGDTDAAETIIAFIDYNCIFCRKQFQEFDRLAAQGRRFRIIVHHAPHSLDSIDLALAMLAARSQDGAAALHKVMITADRPLGRADLARLAQAAGLDPRRLAADAASPAVEALLDRDVKLGWNLRVKGTPTLIVGDEVHVGLLEAEQLAARLQQ